MFSRIFSGAQRAARLQDDLLGLSARSIDLRSRFLEQAMALRFCAALLLQRAPGLRGQLLARQCQAAALALGLTQRSLQRAMQFGEMSLGLIQDRARQT